MKALIAGAGAVGSTLGAALALGGAEVVLVGRGDHGRAMAEAGLRITRGDEAKLLRPPFAPSLAAAAQTGPYDLVIVAVKGYATEALAAELAEAIQGRPDLLSVQNGVGNEALLASALPRCRVLSGTLTSACWLSAPGQVVVQDRGGAVLERPADRPETITTAIDALRRGGMRAEAHPSGAEIKWSKLLLNMLGSATTAILGWTPAQVFHHRGIFGLELAAFHEAHATMRAQGLHAIALPDYPVPRFVALATWLPEPILFPLMRDRLSKGRGDRLPGPAADLAAGRERTEVELMAGAVERAGREHAVDAPVNRCFARLVAGIASGRIDPAKFRDRPAALLQAAAGGG